MTVSRTSHPPFIAIALVSSLALAYEILLMRLFSISQWHHFAYMIISLALLGYGASGTFISLFQERLLARFPFVYVGSIALFGLSSIFCYLVANKIQFNPEELLWDVEQPLRLMAIYLLLAIPFFFVATSIALALAHFRDRMSPIYGADLFGAGVGSLGVIALLFLVFPVNALLTIGSLGIIAAAIAWWELGLRPRPAGLILILAAFLPFLLPASWTTLSLSPYKGLSQALRIAGTQIIDSRSSPLGFLHVVESRNIPWRYAPGLSLTAPMEPPPQHALFTDGNSMTAIIRPLTDTHELAYLDHLTSALPYHLKTVTHALILGAGGGSGILQAKYHGIERLTAVELNPQIIDLAKHYGQLHKTFLGEGYRIHTGEGRGFMAGQDELYDLIQLSLFNSATGLYALHESYLYTVEALEEYLRHLAPNGFLAINGWINLPARDTLKATASAIDALETLGINDVAKRLVLIRSWQTSTLLVKNGIFTKSELAALRAFCTKRSFDLAYYPGMEEVEANQYSILAEPYYFRAVSALLGPEKEQYLSRYKFTLAPATDNIPYFYHFLKWPTLLEIITLRGKGGTSLIEWGYLVLIIALAQALLASIVLILLPLYAAKRQKKIVSVAIRRFRVFLFFSGTGLAFLFLEIAFIQKCLLFLHHPLYAAAVVLSAFLLFAGAGSVYSKRFAGTGRDRRAVQAAVVAIIGLGVLYLLLLGPVFNNLIHLSFIGRILIAVVCIAPLAFCMGMPFPLALARIGIEAPSLIAWAWGINGCASVLSAILAMLLAVHFGFSAVVLASLVLYYMVGVTFPGRLPVSRT